jgi:quinol monooxygenase YgiN
MAGVRLLLQFTADSAELAETHVKAVVDLCKVVQQEPGCLQFEVFRSAQRPEQYAVLEHWANQEALDERRKRMPPPSTPLPGISRTREIYAQDET